MQEFSLACEAQNFCYSSMPRVIHNNSSSENKPYAKSRLGILWKERIVF